MNQRLEGWKLALAVLVPAVIVALAIWFALQALSGDDSTSVDSAQDDEAVATPTATVPAPETEEIEEPAVVPTPTPLSLPEQPAAPVATTAPVNTPTVTPTTSPTASGPAPPAPTSGPTPTPTVDPSIVVISCLGVTFPLSLDKGDSLSGLSAGVAPLERAATMQFLWNFGNGRTAAAPNSGSVVYEDAGDYAVTLQATDSSTGEVFNVTCGTVNVGNTSTGAIEVSCQVRPDASITRWEDATINDIMRVTTSWTPDDVELTLQYEFGVRDPIIFSNNATSGDTFTRVFGTVDDTVKIFWRNENTGASGRVSCRAFPVPATYADAVAP